MGSPAIFKGKVVKFLAKAGILLPQRPQTDRSLTPENGEIAYNSTANKVEIYENGQWVQISTAPAAASASFLNNQTSPTNVTGFTVSATSAKYLVNITREAGSGNRYESLDLLIVSVSGSYEMAITSAGNDTGVSLSIDSTGQVKYTSTNDPTQTAGQISWKLQVSL
jgi:hypothetical protein